MSDKLLSIQEAAMQLGLSPATLRKWCYQRKLNFVRIGRAVRFRPEDIDQLIKKGYRPAINLEEK